jgi:uncharacterized protein YdhG (YjbR/CyaY superfamily)
LRDIHPKVRANLRKVRATIREAAPKAEEAVSHGIPALIFFAAYKAYVSIHPPMPELKRELEVCRLQRDRAASPGPADSA